jgi:hypothetical protein
VASVWSAAEVASKFKLVFSLIFELLIKSINPKILTNIPAKNHSKPV